MEVVSVNRWLLGGLGKEWLEPFTKIIIKSEIGGPGKTERV